MTTVLQHGSFRVVHGGNKPSSSSSPKDLQVELSGLWHYSGKNASRLKFTYRLIAPSEQSGEALSQGRHPAWRGYRMRRVAPSFPRDLSASLPKLKACSAQFRNVCRARKFPSSKFHPAFPGKSSGFLAVPAFDRGIGAANGDLPPPPPSDCLTRNCSVLSGRYKGSFQLDKGSSAPVPEEIEVEFCPFVPSQLQGPNLYAETEAAVKASGISTSARGQGKGDLA